jgi:phosphoenolpyruvate carboxykinase (ATP)
MWEDLVREHGGEPVASLAKAAETALAEARFAAVLVHDTGVLPAVAALEPAQAAAFAALAGGRGITDAEAANGLLEALRASARDAYLLKAGRVGGTEPERSLEVTADHVAAILDGIATGSIEWEDDPDFGYRVAAHLPGVEGRDRFVLVPRFLYARTERVYEYAALVPRLRRERAERLAALGGLDGAIIEAVRG